MSANAWTWDATLPTTARALREMSIAEVEERFAERGVLVLRGARASKQDFKAFAERFTTRLGHDPFRPVDPEGVQEVNAGLDDIELHAENATTPLRPDVLLFCCATPAASGGETTVCDGVRVWEALTERTRALFSSTRVKYLARFPAAAWRAMLGADASVADLRRFLDGLGMAYRIDDDGAVDTSYVCAAIDAPAPWGRTSFANCVLSTIADYRDERSRRVVLEDGSPIPREAVDDVRAAARRFTIPIGWNTGDVAIVDNWRYMHGRRAYRDRRRCIYVMLGWRQSSAA